VISCQTPEHDLEPDPVIEAYKAGIDRTLIGANQARTVTERGET
jgi:hypothetical protein